MRQIVLLLALSISASAAILFEVPATQQIGLAQIISGFPARPYRHYMAFSVAEYTILNSRLHRNAPQAHVRLELANQNWYISQ